MSIKNICEKLDLNHTVLANTEFEIIKYIATRKLLSADATTENITKLFKNNIIVSEKKIPLILESMKEREIIVQYTHFQTEQEIWILGAYTKKMWENMISYMIQKIENCIAEQEA